MAMTDDEIQKMVGHLKDLGIKPELDSKEDFQSWIKSTAESMGPTPSPQSAVYFPSKFQHFRKLSPFCSPALESEIRAILANSLPTSVNRMN